MQNQRERIARIVAIINDAFRSGDPARMRAEMDGVFHKDVVIRGPDFAVMGEGKDACIQSYVDFAAAANIESFTAEPAKVDLYDDMAIASYGWKMKYALDGKTYDESGKDVFMLVREGDEWLVAWRALSQDT